VRPTITLLGSALSDGFAATIASRFVFVLAPRNFTAIFETVSPSAAVYLVPLVAAGARGGVDVFELLCCP
jgi:hypothetical protein